MVQAVKRFNSISRARLNFRRRPILSAILYRNPIHAKLRWHIWPTFLGNFYAVFTGDAFLLFLYHGAKQSKMTKNSNQGGGGSCLKNLHCAVHWKPNDHEAKNLQSNSRERFFFFFFFFFFFNIAGKHERLYCWLSHLHTIAQGRHETAGICLFSWFCYDISVKEKKKKEKNSWRSSSSDLHRLFSVKTVTGKQRPFRTSQQTHQTTA